MVVPAQSSEATPFESGQAIAALSFVFYALFVPETKGMLLEDITPLFGKPAELVKQNVRDLKQRAANVLPWVRSA